MKTFGQAFGARWFSNSVEPRFVFKVSYDAANTDFVYVRSHDDITITGTVLEALLDTVTVTSQTLNPDTAAATIGKMSFNALDINDSITNSIRDHLLNQEEGLREKRVEYYVGTRGLAFADYELVETQLLASVSYSEGIYKFGAQDVQRSERKTIFEPIEIELTDNVAIDDTTISILEPNGLVGLEHGTSYSDAPSLTVAYLLIDKEILRVAHADIGSTTLSNVTRGVLGTRAAEHIISDDAGSESQKKLKEVIYLELPAPKLVYALTTGILIGQSGTLPDAWHLGIDPAYVSLSEIQAIGDDLYDTTDDTNGLILRFIGEKPTDGKKFIEQQILRVAGLFMPIRGDGALGLRRMASVLSGAAAVTTITDRDIHDSSIEVSYEFSKVLNNIRILWNGLNGETTREIELTDADSQTRWQKSTQKTMIARGLHGSRHSRSRVRSLFDEFRARYANAPITIPLRVSGRRAELEVGDVVRLITDKAVDFTNENTTTIDRAFEIQRLSHNWLRDEIVLQLFGSTLDKGALPPLESGNVLADGYYTAAGTNIATLSGVVDSGSELTLPDGLNLPGNADLGNAGAIYYATKDVRIPSGVTVNGTENIRLRIRGLLTIDGDLDATGAGLAGVADTASTASIPPVGIANPVEIPGEFAPQSGQQGYFGITQGDGGILERMDQRTGSSSKYRGVMQSYEAARTVGVDRVPGFNVEVADDGLSLAGLPNDLRGNSGGPGGLRYWNDIGTGPSTNINRGGTGGDGGGGVLIEARGVAFGASGRIITSGTDGGPPVRNAADERPAWSGGGAGGAPGAVVIVVDGRDSVRPVLTGHIVADYGATPKPSGDYNQLEEPYFTPPERISIVDRFSYYESAASGRAAGIAAARALVLVPPAQEEEDIDETEIANTQDITLTVTEAFGNRLDPRVTQLIATITQNTVTPAYSHANIYVRGVSNDAQHPVPHFVGGAEPTRPFDLPADGETYEVIARPALANGVEATAGVVQQLVVTSASGLPPILVGTSNILSDPNFVLTNAVGFNPYWTKFGASPFELGLMTINPSGGEDGGPVLEIDSGIGGPTGDFGLRSTQVYAVAPGDFFYLRLRINWNNATAGNFIVRLRELDDSFAQLTTTDLLEFPAFVSNVWTTYEGQASVLNLSTRFVQIELFDDVNHTNGTILIQNLEVAASRLSDLSTDNRHSSPGAQLAGNLNPNPFMTFVDTENDRPIGPKAYFGGAQVADLGYADSARSILAHYSASDQSTGMVWPAFPVNVGTRYRAEVRWRMTAGNVGGTGLYMRFHHKTSALNQGDTHVGINAGEDGVDTGGSTGSGTAIVISDTNGVAAGTSYENRGVTALDTWYSTVVEWTPSASALWGSFGILNWDGLGNAQLEVDSLVIYEMSTRGAPSGTMVGDADADSVGDTIDGAGSLADSSADDGGGTYRAIMRGFTGGVAEDGDAISFPAPAWGKTPAVIFGPGGLSYDSSLSGDQYQDFRAQNVDGNGFDAYLKISEAVGAITTVTDTTTSTPSSPSGLDVSINKSVAAEAHDGNYTFQFDATVGNLDAGGGLGWIPGQMVVGLYTNDGGGWVQRATVTLGGNTSPSGRAFTNQTRVINVSGLGLNDDFGLAIESDGAGTSTIDNFDSVVYGTATAPTNASATAGTPGVPFTVIGS